MDAYKDLDLMRAIPEIIPNAKRPAQATQYPSICGKCINKNATAVAATPINAPIFRTRDGKIKPRNTNSSPIGAIMIAVITHNTRMFGPLFKNPSTGDFVDKIA